MIIINNHINLLPPKVILWGGTGQAKESRPIIEFFGAKVVAVFDDTPNLKSPFSDLPIHCGWEQFKCWVVNQELSNIGFCIAIGNPHGRVRLNLAERLIAEGLKPISIAHHTAVIANDAIIGVGCQIMAGAVIDAQVRIGAQCIVNINSVVGHDSVMDDGSEVGPGSTICGAVHLGINAWVGAGSTVYPGINIGEDSIVGIGSVVMKNIDNESTVFGNPAKMLWKRRKV